MCGPRYACGRGLWYLLCWGMCLSVTTFSATSLIFTLHNNDIDKFRVVCSRVLET